MSPCDCIAIWDRVCSKACMKPCSRHGWRKRGYHIERQRSIDIEFEGLRIEGAFRIDLLIDRRLVVEIKSIERLLPVHAKQLLTYLRLTRQPVGLLINFGGETLKEGVRRLVNNHRPSASSAPLREPNQTGD